MCLFLVCAGMAAFDAPSDLREVEALQVEGAISEQYAARLAVWLEDPLDLNTAEREELAQLPAMTHGLADAVIVSRPYASIQEFLMLPTLPDGLADSLLPYVRVVVDLPWAMLGSAGSLWQSAGGAHGFLHVHGEQAPRWQFGAMAERRLTPGVKAAAFPLLLLEGRASGNAWQLRVGDFAAGFGEGLTLNATGRAAPDGIYPRGAPRQDWRRGRWLRRPGFFGAAASYLHPQGFSVTALGSWQELQGRQEALGGGQVAWHFDARTQVGVTGYAASLSAPSLRPERHHSATRGGNYGAYGVNGRWGTGPWDAGFELARAGGGSGWVARVGVEPWSWGELSVVYRDASNTFVNPRRRGGKAARARHGVDATLVMHGRAWRAQTRSFVGAGERWRVTQGVQLGLTGRETLRGGLTVGRRRHGAPPWGGTTVGLRSNRFRPLEAALFGGVQRDVCLHDAPSHWRAWGRVRWAGAPVHLGVLGALWRSEAKGSHWHVGVDLASDLGLSFAVVARWDVWGGAPAVNPWEQAGRVVLEARY